MNGFLMWMRRFFRAIHIVYVLFFFLMTWVPFDDYYTIVVKGEIILCSCGLGSYDDEEHFAYIQLMEAIEVGGITLIAFVALFLKEKARWGLWLASFCLFLSMPKLDHSDTARSLRTYMESKE